MTHYTISTIFDGIRFISWIFHLCIQFFRTYMNSTSEFCLFIIFAIFPLDLVASGIGNKAVGITSLPLPTPSRPSRHSPPARARPYFFTPPTNCIGQFIVPQNCLKPTMTNVFYSRSIAQTLSRISTELCGGREKNEEKICESSARKHSI